jgi:hypothetical protein
MAILVLGDILTSHTYIYRLYGNSSPYRTRLNWYEGKRSKEVLSCSYVFRTLWMNRGNVLRNVETTGLRVYFDFRLSIHYSCPFLSRFEQGISRIRNSNAIQHNMQRNIRWCFVYSSFLRFAFVFICGTFFTSDQWNPYGVIKDWKFSRERRNERQKREKERN